MNIHELAAIEAQTILAFLTSCSVELTGRVLDYGCGKQPYRALVEFAGGAYLPFDRAHFGGNVSGKDVGRFERDVQAVLCTQVIQYADDPRALLGMARSAMVDGGALVMTYPAAWPVIRDELWHFTQAGMAKMLGGAGFVVERHELRHALPMDGFEVPMGYAVLARA